MRKEPTLTTLVSLVFVLLCPLTVQAQLEPCEGEELEACGGDLEGAWEYTELACHSIPASSVLFPRCANTTIEISGAISGTITFQPDQTFSDQIAYELTIQMSVPYRCLRGLSCSLMGEQSGAQAEEGNGVCYLTFERQTETSTSGTYTAEEGVATLTIDGEETQVSYCVEGNAMTTEIVGGAPNPTSRSILRLRRTQ